MMPADRPGGGGVGEEWPRRCEVPRDGREKKEKRPHSGFLPRQLNIFLFQNVMRNRKEIEA